MNAINNMSFSVHKITKNQINTFSSGWPIFGRMSYCFLADYHTLRIPQQKQTVIDMFALYQVMLITVDLQSKHFIES